jgi:hypothetical protein
MLLLRIQDSPRKGKGKGLAYCGSVCKPGYLAQTSVENLSDTVLALCSFRTVLTDAGRALSGEGVAWRN